MSLFADGDEHIYGNGDPDSSLDGVHRDAEKRFDAQVLFHPFEKQFRLSAVPIEFGDGQRRPKDVQARWTKKHRKSYYGHKNHIGIDQKN